MVTTSKRDAFTLLVTEVSTHTQTSTFELDDLQVQRATLVDAQAVSFQRYEDDIAALDALLAQCVTLKVQSRADVAAGTDTVPETLPVDPASPFGL